MRPRLVVMCLLALVLVAGTTSAASADELLAQPAGGSEDESESGTTSGEDETQSGADEGASEPAETETGPPWTYQMARIALVLLLFLGLAVGLMYWRLIVSRQRGTT